MKLLLACIGVFLLTAVSCFAGGWGSSGGETFRDGHNPWFIQNTPVVKFCVKLDRSSFSADPATAERVVERALWYWIKEFKLAKDVMQTHFDVDVATQRFERVDCQSYADPGVDLTFQFGYGTLDARQREYLDDPRKYVGIAVRTEYDEVNLRGKGFVYISSDVGPNRFDAETIGSSSPFVDRPWSYEGLLYRALAHELGHVFGIPHIGGSVTNVSVVHNEKKNTPSLMSEEYPEEIVRRDSYLAYAGPEELDSFFTPHTKFQECSLSSYAVRFFKLAAEQKCVQVDFKINATSVEVELTSSASPAGVAQPLGSAHWTDWDKDGSKINIQIVVRERITSKQRVFKIPPGLPIDSLVGGALFGLDFPLTYAEPGGATRNIYFQLAPQSYTALGEVDGKTVLLLDGR